MIWEAIQNSKDSNLDLIKEKIIFDAVLKILDEKFKKIMVNQDDIYII